MSKPKLGIANAQEHIAQVEENNREMRAKANPLVRGMMDEVQAAIDEENRTMDAQFEGDAKLRAWAKELLGYEISMAQIEDLQSKIKSAIPGQVFVHHNVALIRTQFGAVDRAQHYLFALEKTIIDLSGRVAAPVKPIELDAKDAFVKDPYTELSSFGLIKLALKRLFKRSK